jgi:hypothetical protein
MCMGAPKVPDPIPPAQFQNMQQPVELLNRGNRKNRRRGLYASLFTSPSGVGTKPVTTGTAGGTTGG